MRLPPNTEVRLGLIADVPAFFVILAVPPLRAGTHLLDMVSKPGVSALLTFERDLDWPDPKGCALIEATLEQGGPAILQFSRLSDALSAHKRLTSAMAH